MFPRCSERVEESGSALKYYKEAANNYLIAAKQNLKERIPEDAASNFEGAANCFAKLGDQQFQQKYLQKAMEIYLEMGDSPHVQNKIGYIQSKIGFLLTGMNRFEDALKHYKEAIKHYQVYEQDEEDPPLIEHVSQAYAGACYCHVRLAEQQVKSLDGFGGVGLLEAVNLSEEYRGRKLAISLQDNEMDDLDKYSYHWDLRREYDVVDEFFNDLQIKPNILYYIVEPRLNQVVIIAWKPFTLPSVEPSSHIRLNVPIGSLEELKAKYKDALDKDRLELPNCKQLEEIVNNLGDLILPDLKHLDLRRELLLIIPDPFLQWVPWELLGCNKDSYLGLKFGLAKAYSLDLARTAMARGYELSKLKKIAKWKRLSAVLFGNPTSDLDETEKEVAKVAELLKKRDVNTHLFQGKQATVSAFIRDYSYYESVDIFHFAGHGTFNEENPLDCRLDLSDGSVCPSDVERSMKFSIAPLVILSACESGLSAPIGGEVLGIIKSFIFAGAASVLATNWKVNDDSSHDLILAFYEGVLSQRNVAIALREARRKIYQKYDGNPFDWAAYTLYGDPFKTLIVRKKITGDDMYALIGYVGSTDEMVSQYALEALDEVAGHNPQLLSSELVDGLVYYEDWHRGATLQRLIEALKLAIMGLLRNLEPIERAMCEVLNVEEEDYQDPTTAPEIRMSAFEVLGLIADRYDSDDDVEGFDRVVGVLVLALVDRNYEICKSAEEKLRDLAIGRADLVAKHLTKALEDEENFWHPEDIEVVLKHLHGAIPNLEKPGPVIDALVEALWEQEDLLESNTGRQIMDELEEELRKRLVSHIGISKLRRIASDHGVESAYKKSKEELVITLLEKLRDLSLNELQEKLNNY